MVSSSSPSRSSAHPSFPLALPTLQRASLRPDFPYFEIRLARKLSASLSQALTSFSAGELSAIGLIGKLSLAIIQQHLSSGASPLADLDEFLLNRLGERSAEDALSGALKRFPTSLTYKNPSHLPAYSYLTPGPALPRHDYYYSLILVLIAEQNPSLLAKDGMFTDPVLRQLPAFNRFSVALQDFFSSRPALAPNNKTLIDFLLEPARSHPHSLFDQLNFIRNHWSSMIDPALLRDLNQQLDRLKEERKPGPPGPSRPGNPLGHLVGNDLVDHDQVAFTPDQDWMPRVILLAKNIYVWLDQLSREYRRPITRLDQIPDQEFIKMTSRGINALWLIGIWKRSPASRKIKHACGNPEAIASAYAIYDYAIAPDLGGDAAYSQLSSQADKFRVKLAADMVPNHVGLDSRWVIDHPDWFLSIDHPPFPSYTFDGMDLSSDPSVSIFLEDHYYDKSDAAVVFKRRDNRSGDVRYIYHGNDGTSMPWNDTAQLDFLNPKVREAVIETVLQVASKFPIIRFDAAMTLSKKHYQRLWFPEPGTGGAIPSRADFSLSKDQFSASMPNEFWRVLVDRAAETEPDTLLLAEAFWMMEGYFVRSLGMHRVYNSAFMHMLRDEKNEAFRELIINTLEYDPQILKRYVNFMNNPDEETSVAQFGSGDKYFGTCLMMSTLPGLPMFGHGQIEGLSEKYGMEYKQAYHDESPNQELIDRHQKELSPLLHKRYLFSEADQFILYDLVTHENEIDGNVFVYSNRTDDEQALIVYHNQWGDTRGWVSRSTPVNRCSIDLLSGLGVSPADGDYLIFKDQISGLEYLRSLSELASQGMFLELGAYKYHAFIDFRTVNDQDGILSNLEKSLNGRGTESIERAKKFVRFSRLREPITSLLSEWQFRSAPELNKVPSAKRINSEHLSEKTLEAGQDFIKVLLALLPDLSLDSEAFSRAYQKRISCVQSLHRSSLGDCFGSEMIYFLPWALFADLHVELQNEALEILLSIAVNVIKEFFDFDDSPQDFIASKLALMLDLTPHLHDMTPIPVAMAEFWFAKSFTRHFLNVHEYQSQQWFHKESMESLISLSYGLLFIEGCIENCGYAPNPGQEETLISYFTEISNALAKSQFQVNRFLAILSDQQGKRH